MKKTQLKELLSKDAREVLSHLTQDDKKSIIPLLWECASGEDETKAVKKSAKRVLYMARSQGIEVDQYRPQPQETQTEETPQRSIHSVLFSPPDSEANSLLLITTLLQKTQAVDFFQFIIHPGKGVKDFSLIHGSKKDLERFKLQNGELFTIPADYGRYRLKRAIERTDVKAVSGLNTLPDILRWEGDQEVVHPILELVPVRMTHIQTPSEETRILSMQEVARLSLFQEDLEEYKRAVEEAKQSRLILENRSPRERIDGIIDRLFSTYFTPEKRAHYREMLLDVALYYSSNEHEDYARILVDYARAIAKPYLNPKEHPFLRFLVYKEFFEEE